MMLKPDDKRPAACRRTAKRLQRQHRGLWGLTPEQQLANQQAGGRVSAAELLRTGKGIHAMSKAAQTARSKRGGHRGGSTTAKIPDALSSAGKIGGKKGGITQGNVNAKNGHLLYCLHIKWHVLRARPKNPKWRCPYCSGKRESCSPSLKKQ